jgi:hypothetical protein
MPLIVLRRIGRRLYRKSAATVGLKPKPRAGTERARTAAGGKVWAIAARRSTADATAPPRLLVAEIPAPIPIAAARKPETEARARCSPTRKARLALG